jgi:hypothetical protein
MECITADDLYWTHVIMTVMLGYILGYVIFKQFSPLFK